MLTSISSLRKFKSTYITACGVPGRGPQPELAGCVAQWWNVGLRPANFPCSAQPRPAADG